jgi:Zn-dependent M28 family amino/carboxypeptidase
MDDMFHQVLEVVSVERIGKHIQSLEGIRHPAAAPAALEQAACYVRDTLQSLGYSMSEHCFEDSGRQFGNVLATRKGTRYPDQRVLVVAHFDTVSTSPGADDNASGTALLLELATVLNPFCFERTVQFVGVNLEENAREDTSGTGTRGSRALARLAKEEQWDIKGVLVLESVAYAGAEVPQKAPAGVPVKGRETGDFIAVVGNEHSGDLVRGFGQAVERYRLPLSWHPLVVPGNGELFPDTRRSDHSPFWDHGYPAVMVTDTTNFRNPHYHQSSDTLETLNLDFAAQVCRATGGLLIELAGASDSQGFSGFFPDRSDREAGQLGYE